MDIKHIILIVIIIILICLFINFSSFEKFRACFDCPGRKIKINDLVFLNPFRWPYSASAHPDLIIDKNPKMIDNQESEFKVQSQDINIPNQRLTDHEILK